MVMIPPSYAGNLYFSGSRANCSIEWVDDVRDAYIFDTEEQLNYHNWRFGILDESDGPESNPITVVFISVPDIDALVLL